MTPLVWNPAWVRPYESFWSAVYKASYAGNEAVNEVASALLSHIEDSRISGVLPYPQPARFVARWLQLDEAVVDKMFLGCWSGRLSQRETVRIGLRWCPTCATSWFHSALFQDWRRSRCPWHGELLLDFCPKCEACIDPLSPKPWECSVCAQSLAPRDIDWLQLFKRPNSGKSSNKSDPGDMTLTFSAPRPQPGGAMEYELLDKERLNLARQRSDYLDLYFIHRLAMEELSALYDTVLGLHSWCIGDEWQNPDNAIHGAHFHCPLAACLLRMAAEVGVISEFTRRYWPEGRGRKASLYSGSFARVVRDAPDWLTPILVREAVRWAFVRTLRTLTLTRARGERYVGNSVAHLIEPATPLPAWKLKSETVAVVWPTVSAARLMQDVHEAAVLCPNESPKY